MSNYRFSMAPNISVPRSKFKMPFNHVTSFNHGKLVPIDCFEILPGDEFKCDFASVIRMSTPIAPFFGNIKAHVHAFFVPMRLVWDHTKEFYGENKTSAGYQTLQYSIPRADIFGKDVMGAFVSANSISHYLGKPVTDGLNADIDYNSNVSVNLSLLKERCYALIWNEYYRAQQLQNPILIQTGDTGFIGTFSHGNSDYSYSSNDFDFGTSPFNVCKEFDYFTAMTTAPQYGASVTLPLGSVAPIIPDSSKNIPGKIVFKTESGLGTSGLLNVASGSNQAVKFNGSATAAEGLQVASTSLVADLSNATAASINSIRYAFQVQKWLERANFGSRFFEMLNLHYGVTSPDARLQRPEYLGGFDFYINVDQVLSTAGYQAGTSTEVGQPGAVSVTGVKNKNLFHKAFVEPGYVMVLISTTQERSYSQGVLREDTRSDRFDFYFPEFANLGDQEITEKEIYAYSGTPNNIIGYQEHWAEYRYRSNRVSGILDPAVANSLNFWNLSERFYEVPTLSNSFIMENRDNLSRALVTGDSGPDYIGDFFLNYTAIREMPLYTIPGLVDHFGTM